MKIRKNKKIKKIIVGASGTGKTEKCLRIANKFKGTVVYFSGVPCAEYYYKDKVNFKDFIIANKNSNTHLENGKKYFFLRNQAIRLFYQWKISQFFLEKEIKMIL